jgi:hypothetical protein
VRTLWQAVQAVAADADGEVTVEGLDELLTCDLPVPA